MFLPPLLLVISLLSLGWTAPSTEVTIPDGVSVIATKTVDLTSQIIKVKVEYEVKNQGKTDINHIVHTITSKEAEHLAWISASEGKKDSAKFRVSNVAVKGAPTEFSFYKVELLSMIGAGGSATVVVEYWLTEALIPYPEEITQAENQFVLFDGVANTPSVYPVEKESSSFKVGSPKPLSFTEHNPSKYGNDKVSYGPYENQKTYSRKEISIHYENNAPFLVATSVERWIELSNWGNIAVEEHIEIVHMGAKLKGSFSRLDFQMDRRGPKQPVVKNFRTILPRTSSDIYYRDEIGNISTSTVSSRSDRLEVELRPRFPLFGGWRTNYVIGYNVPTSGFLSSSGSEYALKVKLIDHIFDNAVVEKLRVKIVLPETSRNIKLVTPFPVKRLPDEVHKTFLDTVGRPVIVLEKENLIDNHIQHFTLYYEFDRVNLLREPMIAVAAFLILFGAVIVISRLDFTITKKEIHAKKD